MILCSKKAVRNAVMMYAVSHRAHVLLKGTECAPGTGKAFQVHAALTRPPVDAAAQQQQQDNTNQYQYPRQKCIVYLTDGFPATLLTVCCHVSDCDSSSQHQKSAACNARNRQHSPSHKCQLAAAPTHPAHHTRTLPERIKMQTSHC
jgi:hypothetical protein